MCGALVGHNYGNISSCGTESGRIVLNDDAILTSWSSVDYVGGVIGCMESGNISGLYNKAHIESTISDKIYNQVYVGGVVGGIDQWNGNTIVSNCYNHGELSANGYLIMMGGCSGGNSQYNDNTSTICNSYNKGKIDGKGTSVIIGGIVGRNGYDNSSGKAGTIKDSYCTTKTAYLYRGLSNSTQNRVEETTLKTYAGILGNEFINDEQNEDGTWKYGEGYPVLKWQKMIK